MKQAMSGATQEYKAKLRASVDAATYRDVVRVALRLLEHLPKDAPLGTITAGLMFAATAYAEGASHAASLIAGKE